MAAPEIALYGALAFLVGIGFAGANAGIFLALIFAVACICIGRLVFRRPFFALGIIGAFFIFGMFYSNFYFAFRDARTVLPEQGAIFSGYVEGEPTLTDKAQIFTLALNSPLQGKITVITARAPLYGYGEVLTLSGSLEPGKERYDLPVMVFPKLDSKNIYEGSALRRVLINFKLRLVGFFRESLPYDKSAFMSGITLGARNDFTGEFKDIMAGSGTTHLVALSGYNVSIIVNSLALALGIYFRRRITFIATLAAILLFIAMVGAEPSVVRAAIMAGLVLLARELGRKSDMPHAIALTAAVMALADPSVLFSIGFQLSFLSLCGIIWLSPILERLLLRLRHRRVAEPLPLQEYFTTTVGAQLAVLPLIIHYFSNFSLTGIVANMAILPIVPFAMFVGFLYLGLAIITPLLGML
ncbi:MAG: ComEC/Rec2 family competence protein, partial [bacterium]|nr:ComEC/Rec2 family competence protein [bacterium]